MTEQYFKNENENYKVNVSQIDRLSLKKDQEPYEGGGVDLQLNKQSRCPHKHDTQSTHDNVTQLSHNMTNDVDTCHI